MDSFVTTPSSSDVDVLIEQFRLELNTGQGNDEDPNTRRLTIISTVKSQNSISNQNIDTQINDLENLIKKLQDEITEMSKNADREVDYIPVVGDDACVIHKDASSETIVLDDDSEDSDDPETLRSKMKKQDPYESDQFSHIFPLMIRDVILPLESGFTILRTPNDISIDSENSDGLSARPDVVDIWNDLPTPEDNLDGLICDLQAEITEKMETLKEVILEESLNNPDTKFEEA